MPQPMSRLSRRLILAGLALVPAGRLMAAPDAPPQPWLRWQAHDPASRLRLDHRPWERFLKAYVAAASDGINPVAYRRVTAPDRVALSGYIDSIVALSISP